MAALPSPMASGGGGEGPIVDLVPLYLPHPFSSLFIGKVFPKADAPQSNRKKRDGVKIRQLETKSDVARRKMGELQNKPPMGNLASSSSAPSIQHLEEMKTWDPLEALFTGASRPSGTTI